MMVRSLGRNRAAPLFTAWLIATLTTGCASIVGGQMQVVSVETPDCPGARCELVNDKGRFHVPRTPGTVTLVRSINNLQVSCSREGAQAELVSVASKTKGMAFGNILFGGIIGAGVDVSTGAAYDYPAVITVPMQCGADATSAVAPRLGLQVVAAPGRGQGVQVVAVDAGSAAAAAGLTVGDLIIAVDGREVATPDELAAALAVQNTGTPGGGTDAGKHGGAVRILLVRRGALELQLPITRTAVSTTREGGPR